MNPASKEALTPLPSTEGFFVLHQVVLESGLQPAQSWRCCKGSRGKPVAVQVLQQKQAEGRRGNIFIRLTEVKKVDKL